MCLFSATSAGKEPTRALESVPTVIGPVSGSTDDVVEPYVIPDPCGLEVVVCDGEGGGNLPPTPDTGDGTYRTVTAYTSHIEQTDGTPCIAADGSNICERWQDGETLCAANFVPFGTVLILDNQEEADGEDAIVCTVADRLSSRYPNRVDLYMGYDLERAVNFGVQTLFVKEYGN